MFQHQKILIIDFGGQYKQLIARRIRENSVYCEIKPHNISINQIKKINPNGIIFTGGPKNIFDKEAPKCFEEILTLNIPILGICYGHQMMAHILKGNVVKSEIKEYGKTLVKVNNKNLLFKNIPSEFITWMSHTNKVSIIPDGFNIIASSNSCEVAAMQNEEKNLYGLQFHPEVVHTEFGNQIIHNFLYLICKCIGDWKMNSYSEDIVLEIKNIVKKEKALCALSGGVDSTVAATLVHKAIGNNLTCIFVDHGLLRKNEGDQVEKIFKDRNMNLIRVNAQDRFLKKLNGIIDPESKRKIIGKEFIKIFEEEANKIGNVNYLIQGTIYPDIIESGGGEAATIKSHHNVGGLPKNINFKEIIEPLKLLFKDEVRKLGLEIGLPASLIWRQPFPGPGLAVRIIGEITSQKIDILQNADAIFREEIINNNLDKNINQYFAVLTNTLSVGVMGDERTYDYTLALRAVETDDFMTANWSKIPYEILDIISRRIINECKFINRIVYDITSKPPATIEWE